VEASSVLPVSVVPQMRVNVDPYGTTTGETSQCGPLN
jgi:hypothetical protein